MVRMVRRIEERPSGTQCMTEGVGSSKRRGVGTVSDHVGKRDHLDAGIGAGKLFGRRRHDRDRPVRAQMFRDRHGAVGMARP